MSDIAAGAVTLIGAITILNLVLTLAVIRRLRSLSTGHTKHDEGTTETQVLPATGFTVGSLAQADLATGRHTVIMVTPSCPPCQTMVAALVSDADSYAGDALVCVVGTPEDLPPISDRLSGYHTISISEEFAESAFRVKGFPAVLSIENGVVTRADHELPVRV